MAAEAEAAAAAAAEAAVAAAAAAAADAEARKNPDAFLDRVGCSDAWIAGSLGVDAPSSPAKSTSKLRAAAAPPGAAPPGATPPAAAPSAAAAPFAAAAPRAKLSLRVAARLTPIP